jgi:DNA polymerase
MDVAQNPTNRKLRDLLAEAGFAIEEIGQQESRGTIFLTNAILCLKTGGMGAPVRATWFRECGTRFLRPQIELIRPRAVVALGERAYRALCRVFDVRPRAFREAVESLSAPELIPGARLFPVYHCSPRVLAGTRTFERQQIDWRCIGKALGRPAIVRGA